MTIDTIITFMNQLKQLHDSLFSLSKKKTEALKANDIEGIQQLLTQERKHVQAIGKIEKQRALTVAQWSQGQGLLTAEPTVSEIIEVLQGEEEAKLQGAYEGLLLVLADLKQQEKLNDDLTQQSLQFVNMSLDLLQPSLQSMNYGGGQGSATNHSKRSVFDSKA